MDISKLENQTYQYGKRIQKYYSTLILKLNRNWISAPLSNLYSIQGLPFKIREYRERESDLIKLQFLISKKL